MTRVLGVIGGSGLYAFPGLRGAAVHQIETPFGQPSAAVVAGRLGEVRLLFLPRHGAGHRIPPHAVNYRANVCALKLLGAQQILGISAVGSLEAELRPGDIVLPDQYVDLTKRRAATFFDGGVVAHVAFGAPVSAALASAGAAAAAAAGARVHGRGTYVCIEGPQFSSRAESLLYRSWGADVIGMTALPEAKLAREAELPYATLALVTDYDCWHASEPEVSTAAVVDVLKANTELAYRVVAELASRLPDPATSPESHALRHAFVNDRLEPSDAERRLLGWLIDKYTNPSGLKDS